MGLFNKNQVVKIKVNHGQEPAVVKVKQGKPAQLVFKRTNPSTCLEKVKSTQLGFDQSLPMNQAVTISIPTDQAGEYEYTCGMEMFKGKVVVN
ncbi:cupredoxin domain-containing protein [uncultured Limosilactobacillus sp.]|uniref:cupredoxin domain-containing protein n=1 Tax=uncultured Limosilactobacillus sp. TaxID=2837629 RepID=UPI0025D88F0E|nr:cupredoxin domain-containing protein [uncultured Limosilactobacillus sp.]